MKVDRWVKKLRAEMQRQGMLLLSDVELPSLTTVVAGEAIRGSWWGHPKGERIWNVLEQVDDELATTRLINGKVTLINERLWPALACVGAARTRWQTDDLAADARALLKRVDRAGSLRTDEVKPTAKWRKVGRVVDDLERRLLVASTQIHTESGRHARVVQTWKVWRNERGLRVKDLPGLKAARVALTAPAVAWVGEEHAARLLPFGD